MSFGFASGALPITPFTIQKSTLTGTAIGAATTTTLATFAIPTTAGFCRMYFRYKNLTAGWGSAGTMIITVGGQDYSIDQTMAQNSTGLGGIEYYVDISGNCTYLARMGPEVGVSGERQYAVQAIAVAHTDLNVAFKINNPNGASTADATCVLIAFNER